LLLVQLHLPMVADEHRKLLGQRLAGLVRFTDYFWNVEENHADILIVDEAHRLRAKSTPRVPRIERPRISQIEEIILAARVVILFADENQIISPDEVGEPEVIRRAASKLGTQYQEFQLVSQFRCDGSDTYLTWLDDVFSLTSPQQGLKLAVPSGFHLTILDSPENLLEEVQQLNNAIPNSARLIAGWCWPWSDPNPDGTLVKDIVIGDFQFPWEAKNGSKPAPGIPEAKYWAVDPNGVNQAGTVYSVQGFEARHVGVIMGRDLVNRDGEWIAQPQYNYSNSIRRKLPSQVLPYLKRIYRTLLSRGMHSCSIYCTDQETRRYLESRLLQ